MNKSNESPDPGGGSHKAASISRSSLIEFNDPRKATLQNGSAAISTGNLARIKENSLLAKIDFTNQTTDKIKSLNHFFAGFGFNSLTGNLDAGERGNKSSFYTNAMVGILFAGLAMLFVNVFVLFLGYKCIQRRRVLKSRRTERRRTSKENLNSKESLNSSVQPVQSNQQLINSTLSSNTMGYGRTLISGSGENVTNENGKCYCGGQFCSCASEVDKLQLINSDSSFFTTDTLITDQQPLSHLVSPICKLINSTDSYESPNLMSQSKLSAHLNEQLLTLNGDALGKQSQYSNVLNNNSGLSVNQLKSDENGLQNCDCNLLTANHGPMLAVLETHPVDSNLLTIGCEPTNLYNFFESNYYAPFDPTNHLDASAGSSALQTHSYPATTLFGAGMTANLGTNTSSSIEQQSQLSAAHPHTPQTTIQLQLLTEHLLNGTPSSQTNN